MGFYIRKAFNFGPFRINLSKGGLGTSVGVKGLRISSGPRGTSLHAGRYGLYYRQKLGGPPSLSESDIPPVQTLGAEGDIPPVQSRSGLGPAAWLIIIGVVSVVVIFWLVR
jgi:hypothetical protein